MLKLNNIQDNNCILATKIKSMRFKVHFIFFFLLVLFFSCPEDPDDGLVQIPENDRTEQQVIDRDSLLQYFETHYYNSTYLESNPNFNLNHIIISELPEDGNLPDPDQNTMLIDDIEIFTTTYFDIEYEYYILRINQGGSETSPNFSDRVRVNFEGSLMDGLIFDSSSTPVDFDLTSTIAGWGRVLPEFNNATEFVVNNDGTVDYTNPGVGVMFLPSGLGYFSSAAGSVPVYSNLIFKFELLESEENDHDFDNVPSHLEDLDQDLGYEDIKVELESAAITITDEIFEYWQQNRELKVEFDLSQADPADVPPLNEGKILHVRIENARHRVTVSFDERSKGFVWFFSFLSYFSHLEETEDGDLIILLDEPGTALHAMAQQDFLRFMDERLAPKCQVIYSTHSPFMVDLKKLNN